MKTKEVDVMLPIEVSKSVARYLVVRALDLQLDGGELFSRPPLLILGWVTVFGRANHLSISPSHPGELSLLPSAGRQMSTDHSVRMLPGREVKAASVVHSTCG